MGLQVGREGPSRAGGGAGLPAILWEGAAGGGCGVPGCPRLGCLSGVPPEGTVGRSGAGGEGWLCELGPGLAATDAGEGTDRPSREGRGRQGATRPPGSLREKRLRALQQGSVSSRITKPRLKKQKKSFAGCEIASAGNSLAFLSRTPKLLLCPLRQAPVVTVHVELHYKPWRYHLTPLSLGEIPLPRRSFPGKSTQLKQLQPPDSPKQNHYCLF